MTNERVGLLVFWAAAMVLWSMTVWGGWGERVYERKKDSKWVWFWLRLFRVETSRQNCVRLIKGCSLLGWP